MAARWAFRLSVGLVALGLAAAPARASNGPENLTLRLGDLPRGYLVGDDSGCGLYLAGEGSPRALAEMRRHRHRTCESQFEQLWVAPGAAAAPPLVESAAIRFATDAGAAAAFGLARPLAGYVFGVRGGSLERPPSNVSVGDSAVLFWTDDALVRGRARRTGAVLAWRSGRVVALVLAAGQSASASQQAAHRLAQIQQARIQAPTPLRPRDNDDREVPLDNPELGIDVHWLGRRFRPTDGLPALKLTDSFGPLGRAGGPGWRAESTMRPSGAVPESSSGSGPPGSSHVSSAPGSAGWCGPGAAPGRREWTSPVAEPSSTRVTARLRGAAAGAAGTATWRMSF